MGKYVLLFLKIINQAKHWTLKLCLDFVLLFCNFNAFCKSKKLL